MDWHFSFMLIYAMRTQILFFNENFGDQKGDD